MGQFDIFAVGATRINVGLSAIIKITPSACQYADTMKILAGGGTLEIVPFPIALTGTSAIGWGTGYPVGATELVNISGPAVFYLAASGATMTVALNIGYTSGASISI